MIDLKFLPWCRIFQNITLDKAIQLSLSENIFSKQMTTFDKADAVKTLLEKYKDRNKVCRILGIKLTTLQSYLSYHGLPNEVKTFVDDKVFNMQCAVNVVRKFSKYNAIEILREVSKSKKHTAQRKILTSTILKADKNDSLDDIKKYIRKSNESNYHVTINLDANELKILGRNANKEKLSIEEIATKVLKKQITKWI